LKINLGSKSDIYQHDINIMPSNVLKRRQSTLDPDSEWPVYPLVLASERAQGSGAARDHKDEIDSEDGDIKWLRSKAAMRSGYDQFCANRHRKLKNPERVRFWAFAAGFSKDYYGFSSGAPVCSRQGPAFEVPSHKYF
jgi:hypothetical protein